MKSIETCKCLIIHADAVEKSRREMPEEETVRSIGDFFKVMGDPTRIKIMNSLFHSEMCVCDLSAVLDMNQSAVSHQLKILKQANLVRYRKDGKVVYYSLSDGHVRGIYEKGLEHVSEKKGGMS